MIESICSNLSSRICMAERSIFVKGQCETLQIIISWSLKTHYYAHVIINHNHIAVVTSWLTFLRVLEDSGNIMKDWYSALRRYAFLKKHGENCGVCQ